MADFRPIFYPEARFGGFTDVDGTVRLYMRIRALIEPGKSVVLDVGCGRGERFYNQARVVRELCNFKGYAARMIGIDVDRAAASNPSLDEFRLIEGPR